MIWEQLGYSAFGFVTGVAVGLILRPYMSGRFGKRDMKDIPDGGHDISRKLTVVIFIMMILTVGAVVRDQIQQNHDRSVRRAQFQAEINASRDLANQAKAQAQRTEADEQLLQTLVLSIIESKRSGDIRKALHSFLHRSQQLDKTPISPFPSATTPSSSQTSPISTSSPTPTSHPRPTPTQSPRPPPSPSPTPTHHPPSSPPPSPVLPVPICSIEVLNHPLC